MRPVSFPLSSFFKEDTHTWLVLRMFCLQVPVCAKLLFSMTATWACFILTHTSTWSMRLGFRTNLYPQIRAKLPKFLYYILIRIHPPSRYHMSMSHLCRKTTLMSYHFVTLPVAKEVLTLPFLCSHLDPCSYGHIKCPFHFTFAFFL